MITEKQVEATWSNLEVLRSVEDLEFYCNNWFSKSMAALLLGDDKDMEVQNARV
jgi:hypothetical protein